MSKPPKQVAYCHGCAKTMQFLSPDGRTLQEGWYEYAGSDFCTVCWQAFYLTHLEPSLSIAAND